MGEAVGHEKEEAGGMFGGEIDVIWSEPEKRPVSFRQEGWMKALMHTSLKTAYLDNIYYMLRSNAGQLIALGMYLNIQDTPHETAFLLEWELFSIQRVNSGCSFLFATLLHIVHLIWFTTSG